MALRLLSPLARGTKRSASSPPSPVFDLPPMRFIAMARFSCASRLMLPKLIAPVEKRRTILAAGSASSMPMAPWRGTMSQHPRSALFVDGLCVACVRLGVFEADGAMKGGDRRRTPELPLAADTPEVDAA